MKNNRKQSIKSIAMMLVFFSTLALLSFNYKKVSADSNIINQTKTTRSAPSKVNLNATFAVDYTVGFNNQSIGDTKHNKQQWLACIYDNSSEMNYQMEKDMIAQNEDSRAAVQSAIDIKPNKRNDNNKLDKSYFFNESAHLSNKMTEALNDVISLGGHGNGHERDIIIMIGTNISDNELQNCLNSADNIINSSGNYKLGINTVVINIGNKSGEENIKKIADRLGGNYIYLNSQEQANAIFPANNLPYASDLTANKYSNEGSIKEIYFEDYFSDNFDVVSAPSFITKDNTQKKIWGSFNAYYYIQNNQIIYYPTNFTVNYKAIQYKESPNSYIGSGVFKVSGSATDKKILDKVYIDIGTENRVNMAVSDSSGTINTEYDSTVNALDYIVNNGAAYKLYGKSNVSIDVEDANATHLKYRFVKDGQQSSEDDWEYIALSGDVDTANPGYLTQMPYDVSHMPLLNNDQMWSNRNEVYKTQFADKTGLISTGITSTNTHYVTSENVKNKDGNIVTRWVPKTLFVDNQYVEGYASGYKEARKTWGYIKVNQTGDYYFRTYSDDGFYGAITVNGELKVFGDAFVPRYTTRDGVIDTTKPITLEAGKYYPIYLEYFNWGGSTEFKIMCSLDNQNNYQLVGSSSSNCTLYPSKSDSPIDNGNNIFMGAANINFNTEPGIYTIQYALLKEKSNSTTTQKEYDEISRGSFGKFEIEERFTGLSKSFSKNPVQNGESFNINYTLTPKSIKLTDLYKGNDSSNKPSSIYVKNVILTDELPEGLVIAGATDSTSINKVADKDIEYKYNSQSGEYEANEYTFSVSVKQKDSNVDSVSFNESGQIDYRDISLKDDSRISQSQYFSNIPTLSILGNSLITKHGLFNGSIVSDSSAPVDVVNSMNYIFGFVIDVKGTVGNFTINGIYNNVNIDINNICIYKLDQDEKVILSSKSIISNSNISKNDNVINVDLTSDSQLVLSNATKYAVIYKVNGIKGNDTLKAQLDTGDYRNLKLELKATLPELF